MVIAIVALVVIGPENLPKVARMLGLLAGRMQCYVSTMKTDIESELQSQELQNMHNEVRQAVSNTEATVKAEIRKIEAPVVEVVQSAAGCALDEPPKRP